MERNPFLFLLLLPLFTLFGQESAPSTNPTELLENIHLHLNKTVFLQGERLWFKAYVRDQNTKLPSPQTTNLHVGIYDKDGGEIKRKLLYVENGMAHGDFAIDSTLVNTEYTVLAWTNYMRNFEELEPFRQRITILRDGMEEETLEVDMGISVYPEGGNIIVGTYDNIGILVDNGLGQGVKVNDLELVDAKGNVIRSNISTNDFGMGKTGFVVEPGEQYSIQRQLPDGSYVRKVLPKAVEGELGLNIDNNGKGKVLLTLLASKETFSAKDGDMHTIALYQDDFIRLEDMEVDEDEPVLSIDRKELPFGVLTAVLFDTELRPIAHRMFFNHREDDGTLQALEVDHCLTEFGDSLQVDLILPKGIEDEINVSLSALPGKGIAYRPDNSITSSFLLRPYIKQYYQDHYFFHGQDRKKRYELDKRLIIEGFGRYDWDSRKQREVLEKFEMETGIPFEGRVLDADLNEEQQISLVAELSGEIGFEVLKSDKSFKGNMVLFEGDSLGVSLLPKKGKLRKPKVELKISSWERLAPEHMVKLKTKTLTRHPNVIGDGGFDEPLNFSDRTIALEEVTVIENSYKMKKTDMFVPRGTLLPISEGRIIGDEDIERFNSVTNFLYKLGYKRSMGYDSDGFLVDMLLSPTSNYPVSVDGSLLNLPLSRVQAIYFDVDRKVYVNIVLRANTYERPEDRNKFIKFAIENGYARPQEYFTPNYPSYDNVVFRSYGALDWKANILVGSELPTSINIPIKNQKGIQLHIEGMANDGTLLSQEEKLGVTPNLW